MTNLASVVKIPDQVTYREISGEVVLLNLESGKYYGLDDVGARMYILLAELGSLEAAFQTLLAEYEVESGMLERDLIALVDDLAKQGLLNIIQP